MADIAFLLERGSTIVIQASWFTHHLLGQRVHPNLCCGRPTTDHDGRGQGVERLKEANAAKAGIPRASRCKEEQH